MEQEDGKAQPSHGIPPPAYSSTENGMATSQFPAYPQPPPVGFNVPVTSNGPTPMFVTARTLGYGPLPVEMDCPHCQAHVVTHICRVAGSLPWIIAAVLFVLGFFLAGIPWCFCCVPFCVESCLDVVHSCPACKNQLGRFNRL